MIPGTQWRYSGGGYTIIQKIIEDLRLTKGLNDWGLGLQVKGTGLDFRFGHAGKNTGFTNNLTAIPGKKKALIIMTNADRGGELIGEIQESISSYYAR